MSQPQLNVFYVMDRLKAEHHCKVVGKRNVVIDIRQICGGNEGIVIPAELCLVAALPELPQASWLVL